MGSPLPFSPTSSRQSRSELRISRTGNRHRVSARRLRRHSYVLLFGRRDKGRRCPRADVKGRYRWLTPIECLRIRAERAQGVSANRIARRIGRDRRTIDRVLADARGIRLARRLAAHPTLWVLVPDAIAFASLRGAERAHEIIAEMVDTLQIHDDGSRLWRTVEHRLQLALSPAE